MVDRRDLKLAGVLCLLLACTATETHSGQESLKSGLQPDERIGPFHVLYVNGADFAGTKVSIVQHLYFKYRLPYTLVFARTLNEPTIELIKKLETEGAKSKGFRVGIVFLSDDEEMPGMLKKFVEREKIEWCIVSAYAAEGPKILKIAKDAEITAMALRRTDVVGNVALRKGEVTASAIEKIVDMTKKLIKQ